MLPEVKNCTVQECYYNRAEICHANSILVGSDHQACDTFVRTPELHGEPAPLGYVGACHQADCKFNNLLSCNAGSINVDYHDIHADCVTYEPVPNVEESVDVNLLNATRDTIVEGSRAFRLTNQIESTEDEI